MAGIPEFLLDSPHLPLQAGQVNHQVIKMVKDFYGIELNANDYKVTQAYRAKDNLIHFDLLDAKGELITSFVNKASGTKVMEPILGNTPTLTFGSVNSTNWLAKQITVFDKDQLKAFRSLANGFIYDAMTDRGEWGFILAQLLNQYTETPVWMLSSFAEYSTAKFQLVYQGNVIDAPADLNLPSIQAYAVVCSIMCGKHQGLVCFVAAY